MLVIDQFEEVFTRAARQAAEPFLAVLDRLAQPDVPVAVVATMRVEYTRELLAEPSTGALREHLFPLAPLERAALSTVVPGPARLGRLRLTDALVERLVDDTVSGEALPLLAHVLQQLTGDRRPGDQIDVADYERIGGVQGALHRQADATLTAAEGAAGRPAAQILDVLTELVSIDGEGRRTRRRIPRDAVPAALRPAIDAFVDARLLTSGEAELTVSHEALFTAWPRLSDAIAGRAEQLRLRRRLEQAAADWEAADREPSMVWRGAQLARARSELFELTGVEQAFLDAAQDADLQTRRRDADRLAEQVRVSELAERDSELALLLLLAAADEYTPTSAVVGGLRHVLARFREPNGVTPPGLPVDTDRSGVPPHETTAFDDPAPVTRIALPLLRKVTTLRWLADGRRLAFTSDAVIDIDSGVWRYLPEVLAVSADGSTVLTEDRYGFYDIATGATRDLVLNKSHQSRDVQRGRPVAGRRRLRRTAADRRRDRGRDGPVRRARRSISPGIPGAPPTGVCG